MDVHVLTGDCLAETFRESGIEGEVIIIREALIEGPVGREVSGDFWEARANYLSRGSSSERDFYFRAVKGEFDKLGGIQPDDHVMLWFEHDLFCQVNYWFTISMLNRQPAYRTGRQPRNVYRICPQVFSDGKWEGFGNHTGEDLKACLSNRVAFGKGDFTLGDNLWQAYQSEDIVALAIYSKSLSPCFPRLDEVCRAEVERKRNARPQKALEEILSKGYTNFSDIFSQFSKREGIYGFGDAQVDHMLRDLRA